MIRWLVLLFIVLQTCVLLICIGRRFDTTDTYMVPQPKLKRRRSLSFNAIPEPRANVNVDFVFLYLNESIRGWSEARASVNTLLSGDFGSFPLGLKTWSFARDNGELRLAMRAVEKYMPWYRHLYVVTNHAAPDWLDSKHPNVTVVLDRQLVQCAQTQCVDELTLGLPYDIDEAIVAKRTWAQKRRTQGGMVTFNNHALYLSLHALPSCAPWLLVFDDDFIVNDHTNPSFFYDFESRRSRQYVSTNDRTDLRAQKLLIAGVHNASTHLPRLWSVEEIRNIWQTYSTDVLRTIATPVRAKTDIDLSSFYSAFTTLVHNSSVRIHANETHACRTNTGRSTTVQQYVGQVLNTASKLHSNNRRCHFLSLQDANSADEDADGSLAREGILRLHVALNLTQAAPYESSRLSYLPVVTEGCGQSRATADIDACDSNVTLLAAAAACQCLKSVWRSDDDWPRRDPTHAPLVVSHRIGGFLAAENTLEALRVAQSVGARAIELDVAATRDGVLVAFHGPMRKICGYHIVGNDTHEAPKRVHQASDRVDGLTFAELNAHVRFAKEARVVRLDDLLARVAPTELLLQIEFKTHSLSGALQRSCSRNPLSAPQCACTNTADDAHKIVADTLRLAKQSRIAASRIIFSSFDLCLLKYVYELDRAFAAQRLFVPIFLYNEAETHARCFSAHHFYGVTAIVLGSHAQMAQKVRACRDAVANMRVEIGVAGKLVDESQCVVAVNSTAGDYEQEMREALAVPDVDYVIVDRIDLAVQMPAA